MDLTRCGTCNELFEAKDKVVWLRYPGQAVFKGEPKAEERRSLVHARHPDDPMSQVRWTGRYSEWLKREAD